jgi:hypothetical protein
VTVAPGVAVAGREVEFDRCANFRDLGGLAGRDGRVVRRGKLFRSMTPEYMTPGDVQKAHDLGIRLVVDLRGPRFQSSGAIGEAPARRVSPGRRRALAPNKQALAEYLRLSPADALIVVLDRMGKVYANAAGAISDEPEASVVHCRLGKDRTGVFSAVMLKLLGVRDSEVIEDYMLSAESLPRVMALTNENEPEDRAGAGSRVANEPPGRAAIEGVLRRLQEEYGGAEAYLQGHGLSRRRTRKLIDGLLE